MPRHHYRYLVGAEQRRAALAVGQLVVRQPHLLAPVELLAHPVGEALVAALARDVGGARGAGVAARVEPHEEGLARAVVEAHLVREQLGELDVPQLARAVERRAAVRVGRVDVRARREQRLGDGSGPLLLVVKRRDPYATHHY